MKFLRIILAASTLTGGTHIAVAQEQPAGAPGAGAPANEEVIITGTRRQDRTVTESSAPIDVLSGAELAVQPSGNMLDSLSNLVPSFIVGQNSSGVELTSRLGGYFPSGYSRDGTDRQVAANVSLPLGGQGFFNVSLEWSKYDQTIRNATRPSALAFAAAFPSLASQLPHYPGPVQQWGTPPFDGVKAVANSGIKLDNGAEVYFFANYANIQMDESFNYRLPKTVPRLPQDVQGSSTTWSHHAAFGDIYLDPCTSQPTFTGCPAGGWIQDNNVFNFGVHNAAFPNAPFYPAGYTPRFYGTTQEFFGTVGYKGTTS